MTCTHCGANLIDEKVCPYCRCRVEIPAPTPSSPPPAMNMNMNTNPNRNTIPVRNFSQLPAQSRPMPPTPATPVQHYKKPALLMCLLGFLGLAGLHRLYTGKIGTGLLYLFTGGLFGIGTVIDLILILVNNFYDNQGNNLQ